jgi:dimethylamine/trimethylamine dehydrogenase
MGPVIALHLARLGAHVRYVTTAGRVGDWSIHTAEQAYAHRQLLESDVEIVVNHSVEEFAAGRVGLACIYTGTTTFRDADALVLVTSREPDDQLASELLGPEGEAEDTRVIRIGDCRQPAIIAAAVYSGHKAARELGGVTHEPRRERVISRPAAPPL